MPNNSCMAMQASKSWFIFYVIFKCLYVSNLCIVVDALVNPKELTLSCLNYCDKLINLPALLPENTYLKLLVLKANLNETVLLR